MTTRKRLFYSICIISFIGSFLSTAITVSIPVMAAEFSLPPDRLSWIITAFLIPTAAFLLPLGKYADINGRRRTYAAALLAFAISTCLIVVVPSLTLLIALRILQGISLAGIYVSYMPLLLTTTEKEHQGYILGIAVSLTYMGLSLGPVLGGIVTQYAGWRAIFLFIAILTGMAYILVRPIQDEWYAKGAPYVNIVSSVLSMSGIILFLWGLSIYEACPYIWWISLCLLGLFLFHESRSYHPLIPLFIFRNRTFSLSNIAALIQYSATYAVAFLISLYLQVILGLSPAIAGLFLLVQPIMMAIFSPRTGALSDKYGTRYISSAGLVLTTAGLAIFAYLPAISIPSILFLLLLLGIGSALFGAPNNSAIMGSVKPAYHGIASSMLALARSFGQAVSMSIVTLLLSWQTQSLLPYTEAVRAAIHMAFLIFACLCFLSIFASFARETK